VPTNVALLSDVSVVPEENEADPPDHAKCESENLTFIPEVSVADIAEKNPPTIETPLETSKEPPLIANALSWIVPAMMLLALAEEAKLLAPPARVRLFTPPKEPDREKEDATEAFWGSISVAPEDMVTEAVCAVNSSRDEYAHS
jgi:hypothetical protein